MRIATGAIQDGAKVVILPEEVAGTWRTAVAYWWQPLDDLAARHGATVLVGADVPASPGLFEEPAPHFTDSLIALGATHGRVDARVPVPVISWRPLSGRGAVPDLTGSGVVEQHAVRVAVSICYEDFIAWPVLVSFARWPQPRVLVSVANNWFAKDLDALWIQRQSVELWARLFGAPLVRAVNVDTL